jgi:ribonucleotide reductase alpha subunit
LFFHSFYYCFLSIISTNLEYISNRLESHIKVKSKAYVDPQGYSKWVCFKDRSNELYSNKHKGVVHGSNLCVAPETLLLTSNGEIPIYTLDGQYVEVWNGKQWSEALVKKTGVNQKLLELSFVTYDGPVPYYHKLNCTTYHKFSITNEEGIEVEKCAEELEIGDIIKFTEPDVGFIRTFELCFKDFKGRYDDTYCVNEPLEHRAVFNGILTVNCSEIILRTRAPKYDSKYGEKIEPGFTSVCTLSSICLPNHMEFKDGKWKILYDKIEETISNMVKALDNVIDINYYPTREAEIGAKEDRPIGIGTIGWADVYIRMGMAPDSPEAAILAGEIMEKISYYAINASCELACQRGKYSTFEGSEWSKGMMPIHLHEELDKVSVKKKEDWDQLSEKVMKFGLRNSNLLAIAPNASIGFILGYNQSIEPYYNLLYIYENTSGKMYVINERFVEDMEKAGLWSQELAEDIIRCEGDVSRLEIPEKYKDIYKTAFNCDQIGLIKANAERQKWVDQAISFNLYNGKTSVKYLNDIYMEAWKSGLKTTYYLRNKKANTAEKMIEEKVKACPIDGSCESCEG